MEQNKLIKKSVPTKTAIRRTKKPKPQPEKRYEFKLIPAPYNLSQIPAIYRLYADLVLMEQDDTLVTEASLYNLYKVYKHAQIDDYSSQKLLRFQLENKDNYTEDWRQIVERIGKSKSENIRQFKDLITVYCERYEAVLKEFTQELTKEKLESLNQLNAKSDKTRQAVIRTYPCLEFKSQLKDGQIQLSEVSYSEKYLAELGYTIDEFTTMVFKEGLPLVVPLDGRGASRIAKMRLEKYLTTDGDGYQTPEFDNYLIMRNGFVKKTRFVIHYYTCYENGVPGFVFIAAMVSKQKVMVDFPALGGIKIDKDFIESAEAKIQREKERHDFLAMFYGVGTPPQQSEEADEEGEEYEDDVSDDEQTQQTEETEDTAHDTDQESTVTQ